MDKSYGLFLIALICGAVRFSSTFELVITHTNDVHARFEESDKYGGQCNPEEKIANNCFGGVARRMTKLKEFRELYPQNFLLLDAGDQFQGTLWFYVYSGKAAAYFMDLLQYDAMAIGNHEFDNDIDGLTEFLDNVSFPVLSANIDASSDGRINGKFQKSHVFTINGEKIGVIGYTTTETPVLIETGDLVFSPEVGAIQEEANRLAVSGVNKIIALGHSGIQVDKEIAMNVDGVDIVIGGHTNTFLYTGDKPSTEDPEGEYPTVVQQANGKRALVITDYAFGKYLGFLKVKFDGEGEIESWSGNPILLNHTVPQDPDTLEEIVKWREAINDRANKTVGRTHVFLDGQRRSCRLKECNMGNMMTDGMIQQNLKHADETRWANTSIAIINGGGIRAPIDQGHITVEDVLSVIPFRHTIDIIEIKGEHLLQIFERSVSRYSTEQIDGAFLQVSGVKVSYDLQKPSGNRVVDLQLRCSECVIPRYEPLVTDYVYKVLLPSYIAHGGNGYSVISANVIKHHVLGDLDSDVLLEYITQHSPIMHGIEGRIQFVQESKPPACTPEPTSGSYPARNSVLTVFVSSLIISIGVDV